MTWTLVFSDDFTGTTGAAIDSSHWSTTVGSTSTVTIDSNRAKLTAQGAAYTYARAIATGHVATSDDMRVTGTFQIDSTSESFHSVGINAQASDGTHTPADSYSFEIRSAENLLRLNRRLAGSGLVLDDQSFTWGTGLYYFVLENLAGQVRAAVSTSVISDPVTWTVEATDTNHTGGMAWLRAFNGATSTARTIHFDDINVYEWVTGTPPATPTGLTATAQSSSSILLEWDVPA